MVAPSAAESGTTEVISGAIMVNALGKVVGATPFGSFAFSFTSYDIPGGKSFLDLTDYGGRSPDPFRYLCSGTSDEKFSFLGAKA